MKNIYTNFKCSCSKNVILNRFLRDIFLESCFKLRVDFKLKKLFPMIK